MDSSSRDKEEAGFWSCNLDSRGRIIRLIFSAVFLGAAAWCWWGSGSAFWATGLLALGAVAAFEGLRGWCILRAFGLQTPF